MALIMGKQIRSGSINADRLSFVPFTGSVLNHQPSTRCKGMAALLTAADFQLATSGTLGSIVSGSAVEVNVNGAQQVLGYADRTHDCYFSLDGGTTPLSASQLVSGSSLYWVGSVAGYQLDPLTDKIDFNFDEYV